MTMVMVVALWGCGAANDLRVQPTPASLVDAAEGEAEELPVAADPEPHVEPEREVHAAAATPAIRRTVTRLQGPPRAGGEACVSNADCQTGFCEGVGCGSEPMGVCAKRVRACSTEVTLCGCDGKTFVASGTCPKARYAYEGSCR